MHEHTPPPSLFFLHGLESSSQGFKARWFRARFPQMRIHDYQGDLHSRLTQLERESQGLKRLILVGSSFGGLMAACHAQHHPGQCAGLVLLAPALNFKEYRVPARRLELPVTLMIGSADTVCPPEQIVPLARRSFARLAIHLVADDHMLHHSFQQLNWSSLLHTA